MQHPVWRSHTIFNNTTACEVALKFLVSFLSISAWMTQQTARQCSWHSRHSDQHNLPTSWTNHKASWQKYGMLTANTNMNTDKVTQHSKALNKRCGGIGWYVLTELYDTHVSTGSRNVRPYSLIHVSDDSIPIHQTTRSHIQENRFWLSSNLTSLNPCDYTLGYVKAEAHVEQNLCFSLQHSNPTTPKLQHASNQEQYAQCGNSTE